MVTYKGCQKRGGQRRFGNGPHVEEEEDDHKGPGPITSRRPWQPGTLMNKISRTVRGGNEVARNVHKGCRTLDDDDKMCMRFHWMYPGVRVLASSLTFKLVRKVCSTGFFLENKYTKHNACTYSCKK
jgi:hypothetical protein